MSIRRFKKQRQRKTRQCTEQHAQHNGNGNIDKVHGIGMPALRHICKSGKQDNDKNIIAGCPR